MSLGRIVTFVSGTAILAADVNGEINNILNNPITLVSPTTGVINFNLQAHTNLPITALSATSGSTGQSIVVSSGGTPVWGSASPGVYTTWSSGQMPVGTSSGNFTLISGSTGQVLAVTSSNTGPAFGLVPISGGLTSGVVSTGTLFYVSSSGVLTPLGIGTSGQVLTVVSTLPAWAAAASGGSGATVLDKTGLVSTSTTPGTTLYSFVTSGGKLGSSGTFELNAHGTIKFSDTGGAAFQLKYGTALFSSNTGVVDVRIESSALSVANIPVPWTAKGRVSASNSATAQSGFLQMAIQPTGAQYAVVVTTPGGSVGNPQSQNLLFSSTSTMNSAADQTLAFILSSVDNTTVTLYHAEIVVY